MCFHGIFSSNKEENIKPGGKQLSNHRIMSSHPELLQHVITISNASSDARHALGMKGTSRCTPQGSHLGHLQPRCISPCREEICQDRSIVFTTPGGFVLMSFHQ
jgi:hypothetical protein